MSKRTFSVAVIAAVTLSMTASAQDELANYGRTWNRWPNAIRSIYIEGFVDGQSHTFITVMDDLNVTDKQREALRVKSFVMYQPEPLRDVMTNLYSDPANTYVGFDWMIYIARDKLSGKDVEPELREARRTGRGYVHPPQ